MKTDKILLDHGSGGKISHRLINEIILPIFDNPILSPLHDGAIFDIEEQRLAFSTDTYVVDEIEDETAVAVLNQEGLYCVSI
jgi:hydrogenase expression/formation protein HypE